MPDILPEFGLLIGFVSASLLLAVTPGPGVLFIVARSLAQGRRAGLQTVAGVALGNLINAIGAALGLAALFAVSSTAFLVVKYLGAAYLVYLGIRALLAKAPARPRAGSSHRLFRDGLLVAVLNPKTTLFFAAFLPQFMDATASPVVQAIALGALFVGIAAITDSAYALASGSLGPALSRSRGARGLGRWLSGLTFIGLGLFAAFGGSSARRAPTTP